MVNKPKQRGTAAESAVVQWLQLNGHPYAERRILAGSLDKGDITGIPGICIEVKAARILDLAGWLRETRTETINSRAKHGILVVKPVGYGNRRVDQWWAAMYVKDWEQLTAEIYAENRWRDMTVETVSGSKHITSEVLRVLATKDVAIVQARLISDPGMFYAVSTLRVVNELLVRAGYGDMPLIPATEVESGQ